MLRAANAPRSRTACSMAAAAPTMPATFCVPLRRPRSCPPPDQKRLERRAGFQIEHADALGPPTLCAENDAASTPRRRPKRRSCRAPGPHPYGKARRVHGPTRARAAVSSTVPTSLLTAMMLTSSVSSRMTASSDSAEIWPEASFSTNPTSNPRRFNAAAQCRTACVRCAKRPRAHPTNPPLRRRRSRCAIAMPIDGGVVGLGGSRGEDDLVGSARPDGAGDAHAGVLKRGKRLASDAVHRIRVAERPSGRPFGNTAPLLRRPRRTKAWWRRCRGKCKYVSMALRDRGGLSRGNRLDHGR